MFDVLLASIAITMHCEPKTPHKLFISPGSKIAAELTATLSAPAFNIALTSSAFLIPPPTVRGIKTCSAIFSTIETVVSLPSWDAVISRKVISSAPSLSYRFATSTGSPASLMSKNLTPLTTLPSRTSKQGIILFAKLIVQFYRINKEEPQRKKSICC